MSQVEQLYKLQQLDSEIVAGKKRLGEVLQAKKGNAALNALRAQAETAVATLKERQTFHKDLTLELNGLNNKAKNSETRLYSGKVTNPKELSDLQSEIEALGRRREALEEEILGAMMQVEEAEAQETAVAAQLANTESDWKKKTASLDAEQNELALRLHKLMQQRQAQVGRIDTRLLQEYQQIAKKKGGVAVAKLRADQCLACQIGLPAHTVKQVRQGELVNCMNCGRILYAP